MGFSKAHVPQGTVIYRQRSTEFPFTVNINGPGASAIALEELPGELPLALIFSLLMTGIARLATAGRMSFAGNKPWHFGPGVCPLVPAAAGCAQRPLLRVEILLRWNNPRRGTISPEVFIPIAEGNNLIIPLTRYVIAETARRPTLFLATAIFTSRSMSPRAISLTDSCCATCTITGSAWIRCSSWWSS